MVEQEFIMTGSNRSAKVRLCLYVTKLQQLLLHVLVISHTKVLPCLFSHNMAGILAKCLRTFLGACFEPLIAVEFEWLNLTSLVCYSDGL